MASQLQLRRGTTVQHAPFIGAPAEVTVDTDKKTLVVHDGTTPGGFPVLSASGGTMTGPVSMGGSKITSLATPTAPADAAPKGYIDGLIAAATLADADYGDITVSGGATVWTIDNNAVTDAKVATGAAIDGTKISPNFGSQNVITSGSVAAKSGSNGAELISNGSVEIYNSTSTGFIDFKTTSSEDFDCRIEQVSNGLAVQTGGNGSAQERLRVSSTGNISIGLQSDLSVNAGSNDGATIYQPGTASGIFQASNNNNSSVLLRRRSSDGAVANFYRDTTAVGSISVTTTATSYNTSSDYRLKDNAQPMSGALSRLSQLNPVTFTWKSNGEQGEGFIAHELQAIVPEAVTGEKDAVDADGNPQYQGVDASKLVPMLVAAVQELSAKVAALEAAR